MIPKNEAIEVREEDFIDGIVEGLKEYSTAPTTMCQRKRSSRGSRDEAFRRG